jgi:hypothetical protein
MTYDGKIYLFGLFVVVAVILLPWLILPKDYE